MTKKNIVVRSGTFDLDGFIITEAIELLEVHKANYGNDATINFTINYEGDTDSYIETCRLETDGEYTTRIKAEANSVAVAKEHRRQQYEQLNKEFG